MENLHCLWAVSGKNTTPQGKRVILPYAEMRQCPAADNFFLWKLRYWRMGIKPFPLRKRTMKTSLQPLADPQPSGGRLPGQRAQILGYLIAFINESLEAAEKGLVCPHGHHHIGHRIQVSSKQLPKKLG